MHILSIDIETYSPADLGKSGVYTYAEHPEFEILLFGYAIDDGPVQVADLTEQPRLPKEIIEALCNPAVLKTAWNAMFERVCIDRYIREMYATHTYVDQWVCTMSEASLSGLPASLDAAARVMQLDEGKMEEGKALIRYFSQPCKPTKSNGGRTRNLPHHDPEKWNLYKQYNARDVEVERNIRRRLPVHLEDGLERLHYTLDQKINDRGIRIDVPFVKQAIRIDTACREQLIEEARQLTGLDNPNSVSQLKSILSDAGDTEITSLNKDAVTGLLADGALSAAHRRMLELRQQLSRTSVKKYEAMLHCLRRDGRAGGLFQYCGASRTGRWAGRLIQLHNLPQNHLPDLDLARRIVRDGDLELLQLLFGNVPDTLAQLVRTAFIPHEGCEFIVADFSAIEARVIAWLAGEAWRLDVFRTHGKIYETSAARMFKVPIEQVTKGSELRQKGKIAELALGYQGGVNALIAMGALKMGLAEDGLQPLVDAWRQSNPKIVHLWDTFGKAALAVVKRSIDSTLNKGVSMSYRSGALYIRLPSGRQLVYAQPFITENRFGSPSLGYHGTDQATKRWGKQETYGGKLVENTVQAIARDCLATNMRRLHSAGYRIVMHVHDEVVIEEFAESESREGKHLTVKDHAERVQEIMNTPLSWATDLPLSADVYTTPYYRKD